MNLTHFSLFTGIGGIDLAAEWAGFETVGQCEYADYPTKVLEKHWPDVPRWRDIRDVTADSYRERTGLRTVDLISGGFPCQPFSVAGNQKGEEDDRYLWPEMLRVIRELKPRWVLGENVPGILRIAGRTVCEDLEREGYAVTVFNFEAAAVGAPHRRERVFFVANSRYGGCVKQSNARQFSRGTDVKRTSETSSDAYGDNSRSRRPEPARQQRQTGITNGGHVMANNDRKRQQTGLFAGNRREQTTKTQHDGSPLTGYGDGGIGAWWSVEPDVGRVANGIPFRVDRLKCLGNAVVPQQIYPILAAIAEVENQ